SELRSTAPPPAGAGALSVTTSTASATALTMVNRSAEDSEISVYFAANGGGMSLERYFTLPGHTQLAGFLYAAPFNIPVDQVGTLVYYSTTPLSTIALQAGSSRTPVNIYLPIIDLNRINAN